MAMQSRSERIFSALTDPVDAILIMNGGANFADSTFKYVSGVTRGGYEGCSAVLRPGTRPMLVVSMLEEESAATAPDCDVTAFKTLAIQQEILKTILGTPKRIGVNSTAIVHSKVKLLEELFPGVKIVDAAGAVSQARLVKDDIEVDLVRRACRVTSDVTAEIPSMLREGMTELELATQIDREVQNRGGRAAFDTIVCFGRNGSEPHYSPGDVPLRRGDMILVDFGAQLHDYCSDITRMFVFGRATPEQRAMFDVVHRAQSAALEITTAGKPAKEVHRKVVELIDATEFAGRFIHGTGHSIGLDVHDGGGINAASELTFAPGMIMTVEPGVYVPGVGGVRIEDTVLVAENGAEILTPVTKDLVEVEA
jgi:Xaa-Pro dipeptidase